MRSLALTAALLLAASAFAGKSDCDKKKVEDLKKTVAQADRATWTGAVAHGLTEACTLPGPIAAVLDDFRHSELDAHGPAVVQAFRDTSDFAALGCAKWAEAFTSVAHLAPGDRLHALYKDCALARLNLLSETEYVDLPDLGAAFIAPALHGWLLKNGLDAATVRSLTRALMGLGTTERAMPKKKRAKK